jgi:hypothetical protein
VSCLDVTKRAPIVLYMGQSHDPSPVSLLAARYRAKAAWARKRALSAAGDLTRTTLLQSAETYDRMARIAEELEGKRLPQNDPSNRPRT